MAKEAEADSDDLPLITFTPKSDRGMILEGGERRQVAISAGGPLEMSTSPSPSPSPFPSSSSPSPLKRLSVSTVTKASIRPRSPETRQRRYRPKHTFEHLINDNLMDASNLLGEERFWDSVLRPPKSSVMSGGRQEELQGVHLRKANEDGHEQGHGHEHEHKNGDEDKDEEGPSEQVKWLLGEHYGRPCGEIPSMLIGDEEGEGACMFFSPPIALAKPPPSFPSSSSASSSPTPTSTRSLSLEALSSLLDHEHVLTVNMVRDSWRTLMVLSADRTIYEGYWRHLHQMALRILSWLDGSRLEELLPTWIQQSEGSSIHNWHDAHPLLVLDLITLLGDTVPGQVAAIIILDAALISLPLKRGQGEGKLTPVFLGSDQAFLQWLTRQYLFLSGGLADLCLLYRLTLLANARLHRTPLTGCRGDLGSLLTALVRLKASLPRATPALTLLSIRTREALGHMETLLRTLTSRTSVIEELTGGH